MIYITGDTHGFTDFNKLEKYFSRRYVSDKDYLLILGDVGVVWNKNYEKSLTRYSFLGLTIFFIDGNHENFTLLNKFPIIKKNNAKVHVLYEGIYHVLRGEILILNNTSFLCIGGAESIDKQYRKENVSWWKEERISEYDVDQAFYSLAKTNLKVDYVLTHCAPDCINVKELNFASNESTKQLSRLCPHVETKHWYFGHYHIDKTFNEMFRCFYNDIIEIDAKDTGTKEIKYKLLTRSSGYDDYINYPYLINRETGRPTKLIEEDLPEWYYKNFSYRDWYYCLKDVKDVAYFGSPFDNHISKDSSIYLSYDEKIEKNKDYSPRNRDKYINTWRTNIVNFTLGLEKYSPDLNLTKLKERINLTYDQYNRNSFNYYNGVDYRPFPEIKTEIIRGIKYRVIENNNILCDFFDFDSAKEYATTYVNKNLKIKHVRIIQSDNDNIEYDTNQDINMWVKVERI